MSNSDTDDEYDDDDDEYDYDGDHDHHDDHHDNYAGSTKQFSPKVLCCTYTIVRTCCCK